MTRAADWAARHRKLIVAVTGAAITIAIQAFGEDNPYVSMAVLAATSLGVYQAPNKPPAPPVRTVPPPRG